MSHRAMAGATAINVIRASAIRAVVLGLQRWVSMVDMVCLPGGVVVG